MVDGGREQVQKKAGRLQSKADMAVLGEWIVTRI